MLLVSWIWPPFIVPCLFQKCCPDTEEFLDPKTTVLTIEVSKAVAPMYAKVADHFLFTSYRHRPTAGTRIKFYCSLSDSGF